MTERVRVAVGKRTLLAKTCTKCGLLLSAEWFELMARKGKSGYRKSYCQPCVYAGKEYRNQSGRPSEASDEAKKQMQALTLENATRSGFDWTASDLEIASNPNLTRLEKALKLSRTYYSVANIIKVNGYRSKAGRGDPLLGVWKIENPGWPTQGGLPQEDAA